jgi:hypothetical protein
VESSLAFAWRGLARSTQFVSLIAKRDIQRLQRNEMGLTMAFESIASRVLYVVNHEGQREEFSVAIGKPYKPANAPGMEDQAACLLQVCGQVDDIGSEIYGYDELEALENAVSQVRLMLVGLVAMGRVEWFDGTLFTAESLSEFTRTLRPMQNAVYRRFGIPPSQS